MSRKQYLINITSFLLKQMDELKDSPDRDRYCWNFDEVYQTRKAKYFDLTGKDWRE